MTKNFTRIKLLIIPHIEMANGNHQSSDGHFGKPSMKSRPVKLNREVIRSKKIYVGTTQRC